MATIQSVKDKIQGLIDKSNEATGGSDTDLTTAIDNLIANQGGGGELVEKDINFYDYDGTRLYSYTLAEFQNLTELPPLPSHDGLICQEWNWTLDEIKAENSYVDVGATYITDDGKTRLYLDITLNGALTLNFTQTVGGGVTIDWGDGSATQTASGTTVAVTHTYAKAGEYVLTLLPTDSCTMALGGNAYSKSTFSGNDNYLYSALKKLEIGKNTNINGYGLYYAPFTTITMPNTCTILGTNGITNNSYLKCIVFPKSVTKFTTYLLRSCRGLEKIVFSSQITDLSESNLDYTSIETVVIPRGVTKMNMSTFRYNYFLKKIVFLGNMTSFGTYEISYCYALQEIDLSNCTGVPTLSDTAFTKLPTGCVIKVPSSLLDTFKTATNWTKFANQLVGV